MIRNESGHKARWSMKATAVIYVPGFTGARRGRQSGLSGGHIGAEHNYHEDRILSHVLPRHDTPDGGSGDNVRGRCQHRMTVYSFAAHHQCRQSRHFVVENSLPHHFARMADDTIHTAARGITVVVAAIVDAD